MNDKKLVKQTDEESNERKGVWPPPIRSATPLVEQEKEDEGQELLLTKIAWLDGFAGLILGPALLFVFALTLTVISAKLSLPLYDSRMGIANCLIAAGLCTGTLWLVGRRFRILATTGAIGAAVMLPFLLFVVWFGSGMMN